MTDRECAECGDLIEGEPRWTLWDVETERFGSRGDRFSRRLANRLRYGFGRHEVRRPDAADAARDWDR